MAFISFDININHIFFVLFFISYVAREIILDMFGDPLGKKTNPNYFFGKTKNATIKLFNIYIYAISNLFAFIFICIIKIRSRRQLRKSRELSVELKPTQSLTYIYAGDLPVNKVNLYVRTILVALTDFIAQFSVFLLYFTVNDDNELSISDRMDNLNIFNIVSKYVLSRIILKTYYYRHHYISFAINGICFFILGSYELSKLKFSIEKILYILVRGFSMTIYSLEDVIGKKSLIEEFLSPYALLIYKGIFEIIILALTSIPFLFIKRDGVTLFSKMSYLLDDSKKIGYHIFLMTVNFIYNVFIWIIIDRFSPNDCALAMVIEGITDKIFILFDDNPNFSIGISIFYFIFYLILMFGICMHCEFIIINICGLNEYTKKKLGKKGDEDFELATRVSNSSKSSLNDEENGEDHNIKRSNSKGCDNVGRNSEKNLKEKQSNSRAKTMSPFSINMGNLDDFEEEK